MTKVFRVLKIIAKNIGIFIGSGVLSSVLVFLLSKKSFVELLNNKDVSLGAVVSAPVLLVYLFVFGVGGGILGVIFYNLYELFKRRKDI